MALYIGASSISIVRANQALTNGSTQTPKPTLFLWVALRLLYHKKLSGLGAGEPGVMRGIEKSALSVVGCCQLSF